MKIDIVKEPMGIFGIYADNKLIAEDYSGFHDAVDIDFEKMFKLLGHKVRTHKLNINKHLDLQYNLNRKLY